MYAKCRSTPIPFTFLTINSMAFKTFFKYIVKCTSFI